MKFLVKAFFTAGLLSLAFQIAADSDENVQQCFAPEKRDEIDIGLKDLNFYERFLHDMAMDGSTSSSIAHSCAISASNIENHFLVDVREAEDFYRSHIPGSVNIQEDLLATRSFLKGKHVVLIDYSYRYYDLVNLCNSLRTKGIASVHVLEGGMASWINYQAGKNKTNLKSKTVKLKKLLPKDFYLASNKRGWVVLDFTDIEIEHPSGSEYAENYKKVEFGQGENMLKVMIEAVRDFEVKNGGIPNLLLLDKNGEYYSRFDKIVPAEFKQHTYFLGSGLNGYNTFMEESLAIIEQKTRSTSKGRRCGQ